MKPIIIAVVTELICFVLVTIQFRFFPTQHRAKAMLLIFFLLLPLVIILNIIMHSNLNVWIDVAFSLLVYSAGFFGGILQLYNLADRGFSLRILIDIYEQPSGAMRLDDIMIGYSGGQGISWMYSKRIEGMVLQGLVEMRDGFIVNTDKGKKIAMIFCRLRSLFSL
jgi:hypothetical protein